jgi:uncharacterized membrane protein
MDDGHRTHQGAIVSAGLLLGCGMGGFFDGILLHQILQWHNMLSSVRPPTTLVEMKFNMVWDGLFHAFTWVMCALGLARLWKAGERRDVPWSTRTFVGSLFAGWGLFNAIEGVIDHQLLGIHHVHPGEGQLAWDLAFIASGVLMVAAGCAAIRAGRADDVPRGGLTLRRRAEALHRVTESRTPRARPRSSSRSTLHLCAGPGRC